MVSVTAARPGPGAAGDGTDGTVVGPGHDHGGVHAFLADVDKLARPRRVADLGAAAALPDRRAERRRQAADPDLDFREFCRRSKLPQSERSWGPVRR